MREIKFRTWDKQYKVMANVTMLIFSCDPIELDHDKNNNESKSIEHFELMQFTGLKDSTKWEDLTENERREWTRLNMPSKWNGKEIYEGDIIKIEGNVFVNQNNSYTLHKIQYGYKDWGVGVYFVGINCFTENGEPSCNHLNQKWVNDCEVIGNIYENKELLNAG